MKIIYNDFFKNGLVDYLLSQDGINKVEINNENDMACIIIDMVDNLSSSIVAKFIDLYQDNKWSTMFAFDKQQKEEVKKIIYKVEDMCCEYCHMNFIRELFDNENVIAVDSNFSLDNPAFNIDYIIYFKDIYEEKELLKFIDKIL